MWSEDIPEIFCTTTYTERLPIYTCVKLISTYTLLSFLSLHTTHIKTKQKMSEKIPRVFPVFPHTTTYEIHMIFRRHRCQHQTMLSRAGIRCSVGDKHSLKVSTRLTTTEPRGLMLIKHLMKLKIYYKGLLIFHKIGGGKNMRIGLATRDRTC
jgi:hypothetical protein